jgi:hypothetical protein
MIRRRRRERRGGSLTVSWYSDEALSSTLLLAFVCSGCDYEVYSTQAGEHVVYHWDAGAQAATDMPLCGGTVKAADRFVAGIANYYGWTLAEDGPSIDYFWDRALAKSVCSGFGAGDCSPTLLGNADVFTQEPFHSHELAHTANGGHIQPAFISETFATRWHSGVITRIYTLQTTRTFLSEDQLRAQFELDNLEVDKFAGFTWWVALETTYGPAKMADFIAELESSPGEVERAMQRVFGISLAESAALAEALPPAAIDDPACQFDGLPTLVWNPGEPLVIDRGEARCEDDDIISIGGKKATWLVALEFPEAPVTVEVRLLGPVDVLQSSMMVMGPCNGELTYAQISFDSYNNRDLDAVGEVESLRGRHVASLVGEYDPTDGSVEFPRVVFEEVLP